MRIISLVSHFCSPSQNASTKHKKKCSLWEPARSADIISILSVDNAQVGKHQGVLESCTAASLLLRERSVVRRSLAVEGVCKSTQLVGGVRRTTTTSSSFTGSDFSGWALDCLLCLAGSRIFLSMIVLEDTQGS